jgi:hypothetical protein
MFEGSFDADDIDELAITEKVCRILKNIGKVKILRN